MINLDKLAKCLAIVSSVSLLNGSEGMKSDELPTSGKVNQIADSKQMIALNLDDREFVLDGAGVSTKRKNEKNHDGTEKKSLECSLLQTVMENSPASTLSSLGFINKKAGETLINYQKTNPLTTIPNTSCLNRVPIYYSERLELDMQMMCDLSGKYNTIISNKYPDFILKVSILLKIIFSLYEKNKNITDIVFNGFPKEYFIDYIRFYTLLIGDKETKYKWMEYDLVSKESEFGNYENTSDVTKNIFNKIKSGKICIRFNQIHISDVTEVVYIYTINNQYISTLKGKHTENDFSPKTLKLVMNNCLFSAIDLFNRFPSISISYEETTSLWNKSTIGSFYFFKKKDENNINYKNYQAWLAIQNVKKHYEDMLDKYILNSKENWIKLQQCCLKAIQYLPAYISTGYGPVYIITGLLEELSQYKEKNLYQLNLIVSQIAEIIYFGKSKVDDLSFYSYGTVYNSALVPDWEFRIQKTNLKQYQEKRAKLNKNRKEWSEYIKKNSSELKSKEFILAAANRVIQRHQTLFDIVKRAKDWTVTDINSENSELDQLLRQLNEATRGTFLSEHDRITWKNDLGICRYIEPYANGYGEENPNNAYYKYRYSIKSVIYNVINYQMLKFYSQLITSSKIGENLNLNKNWKLDEFINEIRKILIKKEKC